LAFQGNFPRPESFQNAACASDVSVEGKESVLGCIGADYDEFATLPRHCSWHQIGRSITVVRQDRRGTRCSKNIYRADQARIEGVPEIDVAAEHLICVADHSG
jgi:hypothetical protein